MKVLRDWLRLFVLSPEALISLVAVVTFVVDPTLVTRVTAFIRMVDLKVFLGFLGLPVLLLSAAYKLGNDVLRPPNHVERLLSSPAYPMIKRRVLASQGEILFGGLAWLLGLVIIRYGFATRGIWLVLGACGFVFVPIIPLALARWEIRDRLEMPRPSDEGND
jgi:hypothetical protein